MPHTPTVRTRSARTRLQQHAVACAIGTGLAGMGTVADAATFNWTSGFFVAGVTAPSPLLAADVLNIGLGGGAFNGGTFISNGTVNWLSGNTGLSIQNGTQITNAGLWDAQGDTGLIYVLGATGSFTNASSGTLRKSDGIGATTMGAGSGIAFVNSGVIDAQIGTIVLSGANTFNAGSSFTGAGRVQVTSNSTFNGSFQSSNLRLSAGVQTGQAAVLNGSASMTGGSLAGSWTVASGASLNLLGGGLKSLPGTLDNRGTVVWQAAGGNVDSPLGSFTNRGSFVAQGDGSWAAVNGAAFINEATGTLAKTGGSGTTQFGGPALVFINRGTFSAQSGTLQISGTNTFHAGSVFAGAGTVRVTGNSTFNGGFQSSNLLMADGVQTGNAAVLSGTARWSGGVLQGSWATAPAATLTLAGGGTLNLGSASVVNSGTLQVLDDTSLAGLSGVTFNNAGTLRKSGGTGVSTVGQDLTFNFVNSGSIDAQADTLRLAGTNTFNSGSVFTGAGRVQVDASSTFNGAFQSSNLVFTNGLQSGGSAVMQGNVRWVSSTLRGGWAVAGGSTLTLAGADTKSFAPGLGNTLVNNGRVVMEAGSGALDLGGAQVTNNGTWQLMGDAGLQSSSAGFSSFTNNGTLRKEGGSGTTQLTSSPTQSFINAGVVDVRSGTIALPANFNNTGTLMGTGRFSTAGVLRNSGTVAPGSLGVGHLQLAGDFQQAAGGVLELDLTSLASFDRLSISGDASLDGTLVLNCLGACSFALGDTFTIVSSTGVRNGNFAAGLVLNGFAAGTFDVLYGANDVRLRVAQDVTAVPEPGTWALMLGGVLAVGGAVRRQRGRHGDASAAARG